MGLAPTRDQQRVAFRRRLVFYLALWFHSDCLKLKLVSSSFGYWILFEEPMFSGEAKSAYIPHDCTLIEFIFLKYLTTILLDGQAGLRQSVRDGQKKVVDRPTDCAPVIRIRS